MALYKAVTDRRYSQIWQRVRSAMVCTSGKCLPEIATAPLGPRNDNSGAFAILTAAYTGRKCVAGRGQPGPYIA